MINLIITDDHPVVRVGLKQILSECPDIEVVDEASSGSELLHKVAHNEYNIALLDIMMPGRNGLEILQELKKLRPTIAVLMLSAYPEEQYAKRALKLGASGYITKSSVPEEIIKAIQKIANGGKYISHSIAEVLTLGLEESLNHQPHKNLSNRELEILCLIAKGKTPTEIAEELSLSVKTISTYRTRILTKMNFKTNTDIIRFALKEGLVD